ncbi:MAG: hypothetical protein K6T83_14305, partial [Alicyclobacillus sp.]|nr:hypothetical protein [Alicyclobacillus sp.]
GTVSLALWPKGARAAMKKKSALVDLHGTRYIGIDLLASNREAMKQEVENLLAQRRQIMNYKPWLVAIKTIERNYRGRQYLPCCPECRKPFYLEDIKTWVNAKLVERQREAEKRNGGDET